MKKVIYTILITFLLCSCGETTPIIGNTETNEERFAREQREAEEKAKKAEEDRKNIILTAKFGGRDKDKWHFVEGLDGYRCYTTEITHPGTGLSFNFENCLEEFGDCQIYFKLKGNSIYKINYCETDNINTEEPAVKIISKNESDSILTSISYLVISNFTNPDDINSCKTLKIENDKYFQNDQTKELYVIEPKGKLKEDTDKELNSNPEATACNKFYPNMGKLIIYDTSVRSYFIEILNDNLVDISSYKIIKND